MHKAKKYKEAILKFEEAISYYSFGDLYYNYGNSLSNIPKLSESIEVYKIAEKLGTSRPELVQYNIACAYSRQNKIPEAYSFLAKAVDRGYNAFKFIQKDSDMENLRKQSDWEERINALVPKSVKFTKKDFLGELEMPSPRSPTIYYLCESGKVIMNATCEKGFYRGNWKYQDGDLKVSWDEDCREEGVGKPLLAGAECYTYTNYKFKSCKKVEKDMQADSHIASKEEIHILKGVLKADPNYGGDGIPKFNSKKAEPKACDPKFIPKKSSDL